MNKVVYRPATPTATRLSIVREVFPASNYNWDGLWQCALDLDRQLDSTINVYHHQTRKSGMELLRSKKYPAESTYLSALGEMSV